MTEIVVEEEVSSRTRPTQQHTTTLHSSTAGRFRFRRPSRTSSSLPPTPITSSTVLSAATTTNHNLLLKAGTKNTNTNTIKDHHYHNTTTMMSSVTSCVCYSGRSQHDHHDDHEQDDRDHDSTSHEGQHHSSSCGHHCHIHTRCTTTAMTTNHRWKRKNVIGLSVVIVLLATISFVSLFVETTTIGRILHAVRKASESSLSTTTIGGHPLVDDNNDSETNENLKQSSSNDDNSNSHNGTSNSKNKNKKKDKEEEGKEVVVYSYLRFDRSGAAIHYMLCAHSYAVTRGYTYGGACDTHIDLPREFVWRKKLDGHEKKLQRLMANHTPHDLPTLAAHEELLNVTGLSKILRIACPPSVPSSSRSTFMGVKNETINNISKHNNNNSDNKLAIHRLLRPEEHNGCSGNTKKFYSKQHADVLRKHLNPTLPSLSSTSSSSSTTITTTTKIKKTKIGVHIRRGDIVPCNSHYAHRYLPNSYYLKLIEEYSSKMTAATDMGSNNTSTVVSNEDNDSWNHHHGDTNNHIQVVIHSEADSYESFQVFQEKGYEVKLDASVSDVWIDLIQSDLIITSESAFSFVPAFLSQTLNNSTVVLPWTKSSPSSSYVVVNKTNHPELVRETKQEQERIRNECEDRLLSSARKSKESKSR